MPYFYNSIGTGTISLLENSAIIPEQIQSFASLLLTNISHNVGHAFHRRHREALITEPEEM